MSNQIVQREPRVYPTESVELIMDNYTDDADWCAPINGDMLAYYRHEYPDYDSFPVGIYLV
ncbi:hypothetical protein [Glutamicibacter sp. M10]|uniref:hypothetical protein n=1 Tax=Glutamicibacter sp. M10 TaxID=3023076 RepID=UPI0021C5C641|nr:hypothetical protein [Glutamicibacter sp. M10]UXN30988.1 hypothetical protein N6V40_11200 [Glutamicibacter sp. M10]